MKNKLLSILTSVVCAASIFGIQALTAEAENYSEQMQYDDYLYYRQADENEDGKYDYAYISDCNTTATEIEVPSEIDGLPVKCIGYNAFYECVSLTSITIPDSVTSVGQDAFSGTALLNNQTGVKYADSWVVDCDTDVTSVEFKEGTKGIGCFAFSGCTNLASIIIPDGVTSIGDLAFQECENLESITIPDSVAKIGLQAFYGCTNLTSITIKNPNCEIINIDIYDPVTIYGYTNSTAQAYAKRYGYNFESIGEYIPEVLKGDADGNGKIAASDAAFIAKMIAQASISGEKVSVDDYPNADYNGDGKISAQDAALIAKYVAEQALKK